MSRFRPEPMEYFTGQEQLDSSRREEVFAEREKAVFHASPEEIKAAIYADRVTRRQLAVLLSKEAGSYLEEMCHRAMQVTRLRFGNSIALFSPLYIANYCANFCTYCGFGTTNKIQRARLEGASLQAELQALADEGLEDVLILTGESPKFSDVNYIAKSVGQAAKMFDNIGIEVQPMNTDEYALVHQAGADYVHVYQETYNPVRYGEVHLGGRKRSFVYRFDSQERALRGGMMGVGFGALLGLDDPRKDALCVAIHAETIQRDYPWAEISLSCPRIRPTGLDTESPLTPVNERFLLQILCAYRLFLPQANITVSTRERAVFRDNVAGMVATKLSASVSTGVGAHVNAGQAPTGDDQFEIADERSLAEVVDMLHRKGLQPIFNEHLRV